MKPLPPLTLQWNMVLQSVNGGQNKLRCNRFCRMRSNWNNFYIGIIKNILSKIECVMHILIRWFFIIIHLYHNKRKYLIVILTLWHFPEGWSMTVYNQLFFGVLFFNNLVPLLENEHHMNQKRYRWKNQLRG